MYVVRTGLFPFKSLLKSTEQKVKQVKHRMRATAPRQTRAMTRQELPCTSAANNRLASTNRKRTRTLMSMTHLNQDRCKAMPTKLEDRKICTSAPKDKLIMLTYYNMLPSIKVQDLHRGKHAL